MRLSLLAISSLGLSACTHASGRFHAEGGAEPAWTLRPNHCVVATSSVERACRGSVIDLYYRGSDPPDTEVVLCAGTPPTLLVRLPGRQKMAFIRPSDCARFELDVHPDGWEIDDGDELTGSVRFDCRHPEAGHVTGEAEFTCF